jgi:hypothetical protein
LRLEEALLRPTNGFKEIDDAPRLDIARSLSKKRFSNIAKGTSAGYLLGFFVRILFPAKKKLGPQGSELEVGVRSRFLKLVLTPDGFWSLPGRLTGLA